MFLGQISNFAPNFAFFLKAYQADMLLGRESTRWTA